MPKAAMRIIDTAAAKGQFSVSSAPHRSPWRGRDAPAAEQLGRHERADREDEGDEAAEDDAGQAERQGDAKETAPRRGAEAARRLLELGSSRAKPAISASVIDGIMISVRPISTPVMLFMRRIGASITPMRRSSPLIQPVSPRITIQPKVRTTELTRSGAMVRTARSPRQRDVVRARKSAIGYDAKSASTATASAIQVERQRIPR